MFHSALGEGILAGLIRTRKEIVPGPKSDADVWRLWDALGNGMPLTAAARVVGEYVRDCYAVLHRCDGRSVSAGADERQFFRHSKRNRRIATTCKTCRNSWALATWLLS